MIVEGNRAGGGERYELDIGEPGERDTPPMGVESPLFELRIVELDGRAAVLKMPRTDLDRSNTQIAKLRLKREARLMDTPGLWPDPIPFLGAGVDPVPHVLTEFHEDRIALSLSRNAFDGRQLRGFAEALFTDLATLHSKGILHRDLKPGNLLVRQEGDRLTNEIWFIDLSNGADGSLPQEPERATRVGTTVGTTGWMCPHCLYDRSRDKRCDVFAAALVVYSLASGDPDPLGDSASPTTINERLKSLDLRRIRDSFVRDIVAEALQPEPDGRPQARKAAASLRVGSDAPEEDPPDVFPPDMPLDDADTGSVPEGAADRRPEPAPTTQIGVATMPYEIDGPAPAMGEPASASWRPSDEAQAEGRTTAVGDRPVVDLTDDASPPAGAAPPNGDGSSGGPPPPPGPGGRSGFADGGGPDVPELPSVDDYETSCRHVQDRLEHKYATVGWTDDGPPRRRISTGVQLRVFAALALVLVLLVVGAVVVTIVGAP